MKSTGGKINGLDLFSGIGGISYALRDYIRPIAYCEIDPYCQGVLLSRMAEGKIWSAPIWDDVRSLRSGDSPNLGIDIIYGGFPCQDISVAGHGKGLDGERSGLYWQVHRLAKEILPKFIFLENVPAICTKGGWEVVSSLAEIGYDCRWCTLSAAQCGAPHQRERWWLLAYSSSERLERLRERTISTESQIAMPASFYKKEKYGSFWEDIPSESSNGSTDVAYAKSERREGLGISLRNEKAQPVSSSNGEDVADTRLKCERCENESERASFHDPRCGRFWEVEPDICRMVDGLPQRADRIRALGNAVVPLQAKTAFEYLMGLQSETA